MTLREHLREWSDFDTAQHAVAVTLGSIDLDVPNSVVKHVYWSANELGDVLHNMLDLLVKTGALETDDDGQRYRWNASFKWHDASLRQGR